MPRRIPTSSTSMQPTSTMKMSAQDFASISGALKPLDTTETRDRYRSLDFPRAELVKDLDKRYRWDLFWSAGGMELICGMYANAHIDAALRRIILAL